jgi:excisionase family DNA binding protein
MNNAVERRVLTVPEAGAQLGLGRNASYDAAKRGDIPTIKLGKLLRVPKLAIERLLDASSKIAQAT